MNSHWIFYLIVTFYTVSKATFLSRKYIAKLEFDNKKINDELLREYNSQSLIECAAMCQEDCRFFGYNGELMKCRTHRKISFSEISDETSWRYYSHIFPPADCRDLSYDGHTNSSVYQIYPFGTSKSPIRVYCDMETMDGGWTVIQKRLDGGLSFDRNWTEYKNGFGEPEGNVWIGNDVIHQLTKERNSSLYVSITLVNGSKPYELYEWFSVSNEEDKYKLFLGGPATGTLGDGMLKIGNSYVSLPGMSFTTSDKDNDRYDGVNCAVDLKGGWWFNICHHAFLNGPWSPQNWINPWYPTIQTGADIRGTIMMIKRH